MGIPKSFKESHFFGTREMKKKVLLVALLVALILAPVTAASYRGSEQDGAIGVGLNLGTNTGVGLKFGFGDFDILANIGLDNFGFNPFRLGGDVAVSYEVYDIDIKGPHHMPVTLGLGAKMNFRFEDNFGFDLALVVPVGLEYQIPDVPVAFYVRLAPGISIMENTQININFAFAGYIGVLWMFE